MQSAIIICSLQSMIPYVAGGGVILICSLVEDRSVKVGNAKCLLDPLVGIPFGSVFEVQSGPNGHVLVRLQHPITGSFFSLILFQSSSMTVS
jgi:tRNA (adenine-N(1)-)-methyltransferase non-catalytic subunit